MEAIAKQSTEKRIESDIINTKQLSRVREFTIGSSTVPFRITSKHFPGKIVKMKVRK